MLAFAASPAAASYSAQVDAGGTLRITGNADSDTLVLATSADQLLLDVGADGTSDFSFDLAAFTAIDVRAGGGDDRVQLLNSNVLPTKAITVDGGGGNDTLLGSNAPERLIGGSGNDFVDGNIGADTADLGSGADTFQWDPGDGSDTVDGGSGRDALDFNGSNIGERMNVSANGDRVRFTRDVAAITMDLGGIEAVNVRALGGADTVTVGDLRGTGLDTAAVDLAGFDGAGDEAADTVIANGTPEADSADVGSEEGSIVVDGLGAETRVAGGEQANDTVDVDTLGGDDAVTSGSGLAGPAAQVTVNGGEGTDTATYEGTSGDDTIGIARNGTAVTTFATGTALFNTNVEGLDVIGRGGADTLSASNGIGALTHLTLDGGNGDDTLRGGDGADLLLGGGGGDLVDGNIGADTADLGGGADRFQWDPGDGSDSVEGGSGNDVLDFNGSNIGEHLEISANGGRLRLTRDVAAITMDLNDFEGVVVRALGGADTLTVDDLDGTGVKNVDVDLAGFGGVGDAAADTVVANGSDGKDVVNVTRVLGQVVVKGLAAQLRLDGSEPANDALRLQTLAGDDRVTVAPDVAGLIQPVVDLGADE
jgi:Ca2+-binding RTX toxin-like protein